MLERLRGEGFIFKEEEYLENDKIFSVFCFPFGKLKVLAKGIRKINSKLSFQMELFSLVELEIIRGKNFLRLVGAKQKESFPFLKKNLKKIIFAFKIGEILDTFLKEEDFDERIWELILKSFQRLNQVSFAKEELLYLYFVLKLITFLGYAPNLERCVFCSKKNFYPIYFSEKKGGITCQECAKRAKIGNRINFKTFKLFKLVLEKEFEEIERIKIDRKTFKNLFSLSQRYLEFQILS